MITTHSVTIAVTDHTTILSELQISGTSKSHDSRAEMNLQAAEQTTFEAHKHVYRLAYHGLEIMKAVEKSYIEMTSDHPYHVDLLESFIERTHSHGSGITLNTILSIDILVSSLLKQYFAGDPDQDQIEYLERDIKPQLSDNAYSTLREALFDLW